MSDLGPNMVSRLSARLRTLKRRLLQAGTDIVHGHSAHVFQGIEPEGRKIILQDTGDSLENNAVDPFMRNDWSFVFLLNVDPNGISRLVLRPVVLGFAELHLARGQAFDAISAQMSEETKPFGAGLQRRAEGLERRLTGG